MGDVIAFVLWAYLITNEFIYSLDYFFIKISPHYITYAIEFKGALFFLAILLIFLLKGSKKGAWLILYIIFFPFICIFWKFPRLIHKHNLYPHLLYLFLRVSSFVSNIKSFIINFIIFVVCVSCLWMDKFKLACYVGIVSSVTLLVFSYIISAYQSLKEPKVYRLIRTIAENMQPKIGNITIINEISENEGNNIVEIREKCFVSLQEINQSIMLGGAYRILEKTLNGRANITIRVLSNIFIFINLFTISVFSFFVMNFLLWKIDAHEFATVGDINYFEFIYYSFKAIIFADIDAIKPALEIAKLVQMLNNFGGLMLVSVMLIIIFTERNETHEKSVNELTEVLSQEQLRIFENLKCTLNVNDINMLGDEIKSINESAGRIYKFLMQTMK